MCRYCHTWETRLEINLALCCQKYFFISLLSRLLLLISFFCLQDSFNCDNEPIAIDQGWPTFFPKPPILFKPSSYPPHKRKTSKFHRETKLFSKKKGHRWKKFSKFLLFLLKPSCSLKKKKLIAGYQGAIRHRLVTPYIARYKLWSIFHMKYFPQLQCATTNRPMRRRLTTPAIDVQSSTTELLKVFFLMSYAIL